MTHILDEAKLIHTEMTAAQKILKDVGTTVAIFGSARLPVQSEDYRSALSLAAELGNAGYSVATGGGPGIMQAANQGAWESNSISIGLNIELEHEQAPNPFQTHQTFFQHFAARKAVFFSISDAFVAYPGGFGTQDEIWEVLTLIQCKKMAPKPVVLVNQDYWKPALDWMKGEFMSKALISPEDLDLFKVVNTADDAFDVLTSMMLFSK